MHDVAGDVFASRECMCVCTCTLYTIYVYIALSLSVVHVSGRFNWFPPGAAGENPPWLHVLTHRAIQGFLLMQKKKKNGNFDAPSIFSQVVPHYCDDDERASVNAFIYERVPHRRQNIIFCQLFRYVAGYTYILGICLSDYNVNQLRIYFWEKRRH